VSLRKTDGRIGADDTDSDPYGSKNDTAGLPALLSAETAYSGKSFLTVIRSALRRQLSGVLKNYDFL